MKEQFSAKWIALQSIAIVGSILLAFGIEAWWSESEERDEELRLIQVLKAEMQNNLGLIDEQMKYRRAVIDAANQLLQASAKEDPGLTIDELDGLIGDVTWWSRATFSVGALGSMVDGGLLTLVDDEGLRTAITALRYNFEFVREIELLDRENARAMMIPFLQAHASLPQLSNIISRRGKPGIGVPAEVLEPIPLRTARDHADLLRSENILGKVEIKRWDQVDAINEYEQLKEQTGKLLQKLDEI